MSHTPLSGRILPGTLVHGQPATLGVMGGGQLGRMFVHAAQRMGYFTAVLDPDVTSPAGLVSHYHVEAGYLDEQGLAQLMQRSQAITTELQGILGKRQVAVVASTRDLEAYQGFLSGRARFNQRDGLLTAIDELSSAVRRDPKFAEAWIYLAATWQVLPGYAGPEIDLAKSRAASQEALERAAALAPNHPMVLALKAHNLDTDGNLVGALDLLGKAADASKQDSNPLLWRGSTLLRNGYIKEAIADLEGAQAMDPLAGINNGYLSIAYLSDGQDLKAEALARKASEQGWPLAMNLVIYDLAARGEGDRALALWDEYVAAKIPARFAKQGAARRELLRDPRQPAQEGAGRAGGPDTSRRKQHRQPAGPEHQGRAPARYSR